MTQPTDPNNNPQGGGQQGSSPSHQGEQRPDGGQLDPQANRPVAGGPHGGTATSTRQTTSTPLAKEQFDDLQTMRRSASANRESDAALAVMLNTKLGVPSQGIAEFLGVRLTWVDGCINAWQNGQIPMLQSFAASNASGGA